MICNLMLQRASSLCGNKYQGTVPKLKFKLYKHVLHDFISYNISLITLVLKFSSVQLFLVCFVHLDTPLVLFIVFISLHCISVFFHTLIFLST
jgi:hypothetical protein